MRPARSAGSNLFRLGLADVSVVDLSQVARGVSIEVLETAFAAEAHGPIGLTVLSVNTIKGLAHGAEFLTREHADIERVSGWIGRTGDDDVGFSGKPDRWHGQSREAK